MGKNTSISLGGYFENFIHNEINSGKYNSVSEVIRTALRLLEVEEKKSIELRKALELGEESNMADDYNPYTHLKNIHNKYL